jgi:hypothetical protein
MENIILEVQDVAEVSSEPIEREFHELNDLHLALVGGGCADVSPH